MNECGTVTTHGRVATHRTFTTHGTVTTPGTTSVPHSTRLIYSVKRPRVNYSRNFALSFCCSLAQKPDISFCCVGQNDVRHRPVIYHLPKYAKLSITTWRNLPSSYSYRSSAVVEMSDRLATIDLGRKVGTVVPLSLGEPGLYLTQCALGRRLLLYQVSS